MEDAANRYLKVLLGIALGVLFIWLGVTGRLGSLLGAMITPDAMVEGTVSSSTSSSPGVF